MKLSFSVRCLAACCCLRFFWCQKFTFYKKRPDAIFLAVSGVAMGASWMFLYEAYQQIGIGLSSILYYCGPVLVMALSPLLFHESLTVHMGIGFSAVLIGPLFIYIAIMATLDKPMGSIGSKVWQSAVLVLLISSAIQIFAGPLEESGLWGSIVRLFQDGVMLDFYQVG